MTNKENRKNDFPVFAEHPDLAYLDSASTSFTPSFVIDRMNEYYTEYRANIHRGLYALSEKATAAYEGARQLVAQFIHAAPEEIIFTSGTTFGLNALAQTLAQTLQPGDNVVLTRMEHHANLVPWQEVAKWRGLEIRFVELTADCRLQTAAMPIDERTKIVSLMHASNVLGTVNPVKEIVAAARAAGAVTIVDAAQSVAHLPIDVKDLDCDFLVFSGHKMYGPTGSGVLYGKKERLNTLPPFLFGGDMVREVTYETATWMDAPQKFEAGTPNIAGAIGLGAAVEYIESIGWNNIQAHEQAVTRYAIEQLEQIQQVNFIGPKDNRIGVISFTMDVIHPHDIATILDRHGVAVRAGHHCAMPLMTHLGIPGTTRASFGITTADEDIDRLIVGIKDAQKIFL